MLQIGFEGYESNVVYGEGGVWTRIMENSFTDEREDFEFGACQAQSPPVG